MEAANSSETLMPFYQTTWHHIKEDSNLNLHCPENLIWQLWLLLHHSYPPTSKKLDVWTLPFSGFMFNIQTILWVDQLLSIDGWLSLYRQLILFLFFVLVVMVEHKAFDKSAFSWHNIYFRIKCKLPFEFTRFTCVDYLLLKPKHISYTWPFPGGVPY